MASLKSSADVVLRALQGVTKLKTLNLGNNNMTSEVAEDLAEVIKSNPCLEQLGLAYNGLKSSAGVVLLALQGVAKLKTLNLGNNNMTSEVAEDLAEVIKSNPCLERLWLANNDLKSSADVVLQAIQGVTKLKAFDLDNNNMTSEVAEDLAEAIKSNPCLEQLELANNDLKSSADVVLQALQGVTKLKKLNLGNNNMTSEIAEDLAEVIKSNSCLEQLLLANNDLKSSAVVVLQALRKNSKLKILCLHNNQMTGQVAKDLALVIRSNPCLEQLGLADNDLNLSAVVVLQALQGVTKLEVLNLENNNMTSDVSEDLATVINSHPCLKELYLSGNDLMSGTIDVLQALEKNSMLRILRLHNNRMKGEVAEYLAGVIKSNPCLEQLGLANNDLKSSADVVLRALQGVTKLKALDLGNNNITSEVAEDLAEVIKSNPCLEQLELANNDLKSSADVVLRALQGVTKLKTLNLGNNNMTSEVAEDLAEVIKSNPCLEQLGLANNDLKSSAGVVLLALQGVAKLKTLNLGNNNMTSEVAEDLAEVIKSNPCLERLWLANNDLKSSADVVLQAIQGVTKLKAFDLDNNNMTSEVAEDLAEAIKSNPCLERLGLANNDLKSSADVVLRALQGITKLRALGLDNNNMTSKVAEDLAEVIKSNHCLEQLGLANNDLQSSADVVLQALQGVTKLKKLNLGNNNMTSEVAEDLAEVIISNPCLEHLGLANNDLKSSAVVVLQALQGVTKLKTLDLNNNNMTSEVAEDLAGVIKSNPCLEQLGLANNDLQSSADVVLKALQSVTKLKTLNLGNNNMTSEVAEDLAEVIKSNPCLEQLGLANNDLQSTADVVLQALQGVTKLKTLGLSNNNMTSKVAEDLAGVIKSNSCLEQLLLANNDLKSSAVVVLQALQGVTKLKTLDLNNNNMTSEVAEDLAGVIKSNHCLEQLGLANNDLKSSADVVLRALQGVTKLKALDLGNNSITTEVAEDLAEVIRSNPCLEQLLLANNDLKSSADVVLQALQGVTKLKTLILDRNNMTSEVAEDLAAVIKSNPCLEQLGLANNDLKSSAGVVLLTLQSVAKLKTLNLGNNNMTSEVAEDLAEVIKSNPCLERLWLA